MSVVTGFRGFRYNPTKIEDLIKVLAPPYDVISREEQEELYRVSPYNVVRLILSRCVGERKYVKAGETFRDWIADKVLIQDTEPSIYPYHQEFDLDGKKIRRGGFIAAVRIEDFSSKVILPHERTFPKPKMDRLKLTLACKANLSPVFSIYSDPEGFIEKAIDQHVNSEPLIDSLYKDGVRNKLWQISDQDLISKIEIRMSDNNLLIADGHHRYETALEYRNLQRNNLGTVSGEQPYEYVMMYLSRAEDDGLLINPTHRVLKNLNSLELKDFIQKIGESFNIERVDLSEAVLSIGHREFLMVTRDTEYAIKVSPKNVFPEPYKNLAVMLLHNVVLKEIVSEEKSKILYTKSIKELSELVKSGQYVLGFILPPLTALDIFEVVLADEKLPHKTTYFHPKILSGLVFNPLW
ncbi:MAG: DUF1015 domain-containing protein [Deltaproteobacteria bacterium]|nr:DUF1015 domain-containing protein [Deltaproteobacteria bacterium]